MSENLKQRMKRTKKTPWLLQQESFMTVTKFLFHNERASHKPFVHDSSLAMRELMILRISSLLKKQERLLKGCQKPFCTCH